MTHTPTERHNAEDFVWYYASSDDAEVFQAADSRDDAIAAANSDATDMRVAKFHVVEARRETLHDDFFDADQVLEQFEDHNEEAWGEDGPQGTVTVLQKAELAAALERTFAAWRAKHSPYRAYNLTDFRNGEDVYSSAFEAWLVELDAEAQRRGYGEASHVEGTGKECWCEYFEDGDTPSQALDADERAGL